jgi:peptide deformylase
MMSLDIVIHIIIFMLFISFLYAEDNQINETTSMDDLNNSFLTKIRTIGDPILQTKVRKLSQDEIRNDPEIKNASSLGHRLLADFREHHGFGRAIAAPQFGYSIAMICLFVHGQKMTIFNPEIISKSQDTFLMWDDCFSFPDKMASVRRHKSISIAFMDEKGAGRTWINLPKDMAELLQHEIDHLNGILAVDIAEQPPGEIPCSSGEDEKCSIPKFISRENYMLEKVKFDSYLR